jgi:hypothetical protein
MKCWEIIADNLKKAGWSLGWVSAVDSQGREIWIVDAHRDDGKRFIVNADDLKKRGWSLGYLKGGTRCPQRVGRQMVCSGAPQAHGANQSPALMPAESKDAEQPASDGCRLGNNRAIHPDIVDNVLEIEAIRLSPD